MGETMRSSRDLCFMGATSRGHKRFEKKLKSLQLENLDDAYIILMPMFAICK